MNHPALRLDIAAMLQACFPPDDSERLPSPKLSERIIYLYFGKLRTAH